MDVGAIAMFLIPVCAVFVLVAGVAFRIWLMVRRAHRGAIVISGLTEAIFIERLEQWRNLSGCIYILDAQNMFRLRSPDRREITIRRLGPERYAAQGWKALITDLKAHFPDASMNKPRTQRMLIQAAIVLAVILVVRLGIGGLTRYTLTEMSAPDNPAAQVTPASAPESPVQAATPVSAPEAQPTGDISFPVHLNKEAASEGKSIEVSMPAAEGIRVVRVRVPAGIKSGTRIRVAGEGYPATSTAPAGDLYVEITVD